VPLVSNPIWQGPAKTLLWVASDIPLVEKETPLLAQAIAEVANELGLRATLIGRFPEHLKSAFADCEHIAWLDFKTYRQFLAASKGAIAIAPLPVLSQYHQAFVNSKSDIKVVDFLGHSIPAVYSAAFPYRNSDLQPRPLIGDDPQQWKEAIRGMAREPGRFIAHSEVAMVHRLRSYEVPAAVLRSLIETAVGPSRPFPRVSLNIKLRAVEQWLRRWRRSKV
jgi:hypothetical protein